jgi:ATP-binding cassette subfamily B (MDR/TAP) protein 1
MEDKLSLIDDNTRTNTVSIRRFFEYNTRKDNIMLAIGTIGAVIAGLLLPSIALIMGSIANNFGDDDVGASDMSEAIGNTSKLVGIVAGVIFVFSYIFFAFWQHLAENISLKLRKVYLRALLNQEIAYFEHI